jgi:hypothetical protein
MLLRVGQFSPCSACQRFCHAALIIPAVSRYDRYALPVQRSVQKHIQGIDNCVPITATLRLEQLPTDQCVDLAIAYFEREAAQAFPSPLSMRPHTFGSGG